MAYYETLEIQEGQTYHSDVSAFDESGNESGKGSCDTIYAPDTKDPVISLNGDNPVYLHQGETYVEQGATAYDNVDGNITNRITIGGDVNFSTWVIGTHALTYTVADAAGHPVQTTRTIVVESLAPNDGMTIAQTSGSTEWRDGTQTFDAEPTGSSPHTDIARLYIPLNLKKGDTILLSGSGFFEGQTTTSQTTVAITSKDAQNAYTAVTNERDLILAGIEQEFQIPLVLINDANGVAIDIDMGLWPGHAQINGLIATIDRSSKTVSNFYIKRLIKPSALNTIGIELGWAAISGADNIRVWAVSPKDDIKRFDSSSISGTATSVQINNLPLNDGVNIYIAPIVGGVQQPENSIFYLPGNVIDRPSNGFMNCELSVDSIIDKGYPALHLGQVPVVSNYSEGDDNAFADTDGNNVVGTGDNLRISNRAAAQTAAKNAGTPYPSLGRK